MRIGKNPAKENNSITTSAYHRVVVPVYIPNLKEDYFKHGLEILQWCLESLLKTSHQKTRISIFNNASCEPVSSYLQQLYDTHQRLDQLVHSKHNIGKINAIFSCVRGQSEPLITITDADVLFTHGWQHGVESVFKAFPQAGMVSPVPVSNIYKHKAATSTFGYGFTKRLLCFQDVEDRDALLKFQESVGSTLFTGDRLTKFLCLKNSKGTAVLSCGHFVATLRAEVFQEAPVVAATDLISKETDFNYIDKPNNDLGYLRLATVKNYAYHLGNSPEAWMKETFNKIASKNVDAFFKNEPPKATKKSKFTVRRYAFLQRLFLRQDQLRRYFFRRKGMKDAGY